MNTDLESKFIENSFGRNILTIGSINSGKSFCALHYIYHALQTNMFEQYHLIIPNFKSEQNGSYKFLENYKEKVFVYPEYDPVVIKHVNDLRYQFKIFFLIDDASGDLQESGLQSDLLKLFSTIRHGKGATAWLITHGAKIAKKSLRNVTTFTFITNILSGKVLEDIFEDFLSIKYRDNHMKYDDFFQHYMDMVRNMEHPQMLIMRNTDGKIYVDFGVAHWNILQKDTNVQPIKPTKQIKQQPKQNTQQPIRKPITLKGIKFISKPPLYVQNSRHQNANRATDYGGY